VTVSPSASLWYSASARISESYGWRLRARDEIVFVAGPRVAHASEGIDRIRSAFYPRARTLKGPAATVRAAHWLSNGDASLTWLLTGHFVQTILSSPPCTWLTGPLTVYDLERNRGGRPSGLVLSACEAGRSEVHPGDELMGTSAALLSLGTRSRRLERGGGARDGVIPVMMALHEQLVHGRVGTGAGDRPGASTSRSLIIRRSRRRRPTSAGGVGSRSFRVVGRWLS